MTTSERFQVCIFGSGFTGSLLAWALARAGLRVVIVDRAEHPRFAIGESSTPLADFLLEQIVDEFDLPEARPLSRWGSWQRAYPELRAGMKRGFSYYWHTAGSPFSERDARHDASLLVQASVNDEVSDTHWMRCDVDHWFLRQAVAAGAVFWSPAEVTNLSGSPGDWLVQVRRHTRHLDELQAAQLVDATGGGGLLSRWLEVGSLHQELKVRTSALFGHFRGVQPMTEWLGAHGMDSQDDPFDGDHAAQHHLLDEGWLWMLRFADGTTSAGLTSTRTHSDAELNSLTQGSKSGEARRQLWTTTLTAYPTLDDLFRDAQLVDPQVDHTAQLGFMPRISRLSATAAGVGWLMLPTTAGVIDPLHSTGIAHGLSGVQRAARMILASDEGFIGDKAAGMYSADVVAEVLWIDEIVSACYAAKQRGFEAFVAACGLYFVAAVHCERQMAGRGRLRDGFLLHRCAELRRLAAWFSRSLQQLPLDVAFNAASDDVQRIIDELRLRLEPWNDFGLLDPRSNHRIARSAAAK